MWRESGRTQTFFTLIPYSYEAVIHMCTAMLFLQQAEALRETIFIMWLFIILYFLFVTFLSST